MGMAQRCLITTINKTIIIIVLMNDLFDVIYNSSCDNSLNQYQ